MKIMIELKRETHRAQSGQAIVLMALMMLGLMASLGLAIDGGGLFFLYRDAQNGTDAAVIAATYARCTNGDMIFAGTEAARANGFDNNGTSNWVTVSNPPDNGIGAGDPDYVEVSISALKPSYFIQLVFPEQLRVSSRAVGRCRPPLLPTQIPPLLGLSTTCNNTVNWNASDATLLTLVPGGSVVHSNYEIQSGGGGHTNEIIGAATSVGGVKQGNEGNTTWSPYYQANLGPDHIVQNPLEEHFRIEDYAPTGAIGKWERDNGLYTHIVGDWSPKNVTLEGLYYIEGNFQVQTNDHVSFGTRGVTIVATGTISYSGGVALHYYREGILAFSGYQGRNCGDNAISISGSTDYIYGVLYAPYAGVNIRASDMRMTGAIVANTIDFSGSKLRFTYDPSILPYRPALVTVSE